MLRLRALRLCWVIACWREAAAAMAAETEVPNLDGNLTDSLRYFGMFDGDFRQAVERIGGAERCVAVLTRLQTLLYPPPPTPTDVSAAEQQVRVRLVTAVTLTLTAMDVIMDE